ncbi:MAG: autotransporter-associated beta strand repeat-containing protein [Verrucomicrobia bacterium]|nr:autotransporter-associated beta strand repeat-containing protein [Verrucomicrobiota bacterium]
MLRRCLPKARQAWFFLASGALLAAAPEATRLYWDTSDQPGLQGGPARWDATSAQWSSTPEGTGPRAAWRPGAIAVFADTAAPLVFIDGEIEASGIEAGGMELAGGTLRVPADGLTVANEGELTIASAMKGPGAVTKTGQGQLTLTAINTPAGGFLLAAGKLRIFTPEALGGLPLRITGKVGLLAAADNIVLTNPIDLAPGARLTLAAYRPSLELTGAVTGTGSIEKTERGLVTLKGPWSDAVALTCSLGEVVFSPPRPVKLSATVAGGLFRAGPGSLAADTRLTISKGAALAASGACTGIEAWVNSGWISPGSDGVLALDGQETLDQPLNLERFAALYPNLALGACGTVVVNGGFRAVGKTLRLGGGGGHLEIRSAIKGDTALVIGSPGAAGVVTLSAANTFTGGVQVDGGTLRLGHDRALPPGVVTLGAPLSNEQTCFLDLNNRTVPNPIQLRGRASIKNSGGGTALLSGKVTAGDSRLRFVAEAGSLLRVTGTVSSSTLIIVGKDARSDDAIPNVVELSPAEPNTCTRLQVERAVQLRARDGVGLPAAARLVLQGGIFESSGEFTRPLVPGGPDGQGGVTLIQSSGSGSGFSARGGVFTVRLTGVPALVWGMPAKDGLAPGDLRLRLNTATADSRLVFDLPLDLSGAEVDRKGKPTPLHTVVVDAGEVVLNRTVSNSGSTPAGLNKLGAGTLTLAGVNTYDGPTVVTQGTLLFKTPQSVAGSGRSIRPANGTVVAAGYPVDNAFLQRIESPSAMLFTVALGADSAQPLDFNSDSGALLRGATLGATGAFTYSGRITPAGGVLRVGGGGGRLVITDPANSPAVLGGSFSPGDVQLARGGEPANTLVALSGRLAVGMRLWTSPPAAPDQIATLAMPSTGAAPVLQASATDRWVDAEWTFEGEPAEGFLAEMSYDGRTFVAAGKSWPGERRLPVYVNKPDIKPGDTVFLRVAALARQGLPGSWSNIAQARYEGRRDIEKEIIARFPDTGDRRSYHASDPERLITYTDAQKEAQRAAGRQLAAALLALSGNVNEPRRFTIPPGIYRVDVNQLQISRLKQFTLHAPGVEIIVDSEKSGGAFVFTDCEEVTLTGRAEGDSAATGQFLGIDSEQLPFSLALIHAVNVAANTLDVEIMPGYEMNIPQDERMLAFRPNGALANFEQIGWSKVQPLGGRRVRLTSASLNNPRIQNTVLRPGYLLTLHNNVGHGTRTHGVYSATRCRDMTYESIRVFNGGGSPADHGTAGRTVYRDWRNIPRPGTNRLEITAGLGQFSKDGGSFLFENCEFGPHLDDGINLLSTMAAVQRQDSPDTVVVSGYAAPKPGATLSFYDFMTWRNLGEARVVNADALKEPETLAALNAYCQAHRITEAGRGAWRAKLDRPVALPPYAMIVYSNYRADNITVRGCLFRDQVAQIMLLQGATSGLIENNLLLRSAGPAISMQFAQYWWEGPMPGNFIVRNNVIRDNPVWSAVSGFDGSGSISVWANTVKPTAGRLFSGFRLEGNTIINASSFGILLRNTRNATVRYNRIVNPGVNKLEQDYRGVPAWKTYAGVSLDHVSNAVVSDNEFVLTSPWCRRDVVVEPSCDATTITVERNRTVAE